MPCHSRWLDYFRSAVLASAAYGAHRIIHKQEQVGRAQPRGTGRYPLPQWPNLALILALTPELLNLKLYRAQAPRPHQIHLGILDLD